MTLATDLRDLDGHDQAALVRRGEVTARELALAAIKRIAASNDQVNAVVITRYEQALAEATAAFAGNGRASSAAADGPASPLVGVPFLLKDLGPTCAGAEATLGSAFMAGYVPGHDSELVRRFRRAGLSILGKTNSAEFGVMPTTEPVPHGPTRNPWDLTRTAGGSSGGAAAAVAAGYVPIAHANDAGGSIRLPAACCGVFGLKPTRARTPLGPDVGDLMNGLACEHVITRTVRDSAAALDAIAGPAPGDPYWAPPFAGSFAEAAQRGTGRRLRIAFTTRDAVTPLHPDCVNAVRRAAQICADLGHEVVQDAPEVNFADLADPFLTVWAAGVSSAITAYATVTGRQPRPELFEEVTWWLYERGRQHSAAEYLVTVTGLQRAARRLAAFHDRYDVLVSASAAQPAPRLGAFDSGTPASRLASAIEFVYETPLANLTGQPAMSMPLHQSATGLPVGAQFTGRFGEEATLLGLAGEIERAHPWSLAPLTVQPLENNR